MDKELESLVEDRVRIVEALRLIYQVGFGVSGGGVQEDIIEASTALYKVRDRISAEIKKLNGGVSKHELALREIYEVWAGSEGFKPETAPEAYQARLLDQIAGIASQDLDEIGVVHD